MELPEAEIEKLLRTAIEQKRVIQSRTRTSREASSRMTTVFTKVRSSCSAIRQVGKAVSRSLTGAGHW